MFGQLIREPLTHFLVAAGLVFVLVDLSSFDQNIDGDTIVISDAEVQSLTARWHKQWRKPPSELELKGLIEAAIRDEVYFREALRLGLDQGDAVVRNRMIQKMRFLQSEALADPTQGELAEWLSQHQAKYRAGPRYSFEQVYLGEQISGLDVDKLAEQLNHGELKPDEVRKSLGLPVAFQDEASDAIAIRFAGKFVTSLNDLETGQWQGPVYSGFGAHMIKLISIQQAAEPSLMQAEIRQRVDNDWRNAQQLKLQNDHIERLKQRYRIEVAEP